MIAQLVSVVVVDMRKKMLDMCHLRVDDIDRMMLSPNNVAHCNSVDVYIMNIILPLLIHF